MILNHFQSFNAVSKELNPSKQDELMEYDQKMDMHVRKHGLQPQNSLIQTCMHEMSFNSPLMTQIMT